MNNQIKAIVFDLGGVFFTEGKRVAIEKLSKEYGYDKEIVDNILRSSKAIDLRKGLISDEEFWSWVQKQLPEGYDAKLVKDTWYDGYILDEDIFNLVKRLKGKYKLIIFSGNVKSRVEYLDKKYDFRKYFDLEVYSYEHHLGKGEKEFVVSLLKESGYKPEEMIYIDDGEKPLALAREFGIHTILYEQGKTQELEKALSNFGVQIN